MVAAMKAVTEGMKCATAAKMHKVPRKSLEIGSRDEFIMAPNPAPLLS